MIERMIFPLVIRETTMTGSREADGALSTMGEEEFRAFYERTARPLWAYLSRITGNRQQADDYLQEAYYRLYRSGSKFESESHRRNCLYQIATNIVRDAARRSRRSVEVPLEDESGESAIAVSDEPSPERQVSTRNELAQAMKQLEPLQRELLWLAYAQGASHQEIGEILGLRPISIRTLLLRARRKMAAILNGTAPGRVKEDRR